MESTARLGAKRLLVVAILILGLAITAGVTWRSHAQSNAALADDVEQRSEEIADRLSASLEDSFVGTEAVAKTIDDRWNSPADFAGYWQTRSATFPGDSFTLVVVAVPVADLAGFVEAERTFDPNFEVRFLNEAPAGGRHFLIMRVSDDAATFSGIDISSFANQAEELNEISVGSTRVRSRDIRQPDREPVPDQMELFHRHVANGPDGRSYDAWTGVQVDLAALAAMAFAGQPDGVGFDWTTDISALSERMGLDRSAGVVERPTTFTTRNVTSTLVVRTDGSLTEAGDPLRTMLIGSAISVAAAMITGLGLLFLTLIHRIDRSETEARRDELTGLPNRRWLLEHLADNGDAEVAILFCDLDRFKVVNDSAGHTVGDDLLRQVADRFSTTLAERHPVARFGGDEFIVVVHGSAESVLDQASGLAEELGDALSVPFDLGETEFRSSISIGIASGPTHDKAAIDELVRAADTALVECKRSGRNGFRVYDSSMREIDTGRLVFEQELRAALDRGDLTVHYQPLVDEARKVFSFEALVRWRRDGELMAPGMFLPIVDEIDRMADLGRIVLDVAIAQLAEWTESGAVDESVSLHVNVDPAQLADATFPGYLAAVLTEHQIAARRLVLELTENEWMDIAENTESVLAQLAEQGVGIAIDDFGSGYSSIARVLDIEGLTEIKIDRSIVQRINEGQSQSSFLSGFVKMAAGLDVLLIAEGVETVEEHRALLAAGVSHFQGYLFGRPAASDVVTLEMFSPNDPLTETPWPGTNRLPEPSRPRAAETTGAENGTSPE